MLYVVQFYLVNGLGFGEFWRFVIYFTCYPNGTMSIEHRNEKFTPDLSNVFCSFLFTFNSFYNNRSDCTWMSTKWQINAFIIIVIIFSQPIICLNSLCTTLKIFDIFLQNGKINWAKKFLWCNDCGIETLYVRYVDARLTQILIYIMLPLLPFDNNSFLFFC